MGGIANPRHESSEFDSHAGFQKLYGAVAQLGEQRTHIPRVVGSIPTSTTKVWVARLGVRQRTVNPSRETSCLVRHQGNPPKHCPRGEIGKLTALKMPRCNGLSVQVRPRAPNNLT
jgi:hypothetical protein